jgi:hypothetical protein
VIPYKTLSRNHGASCGEGRTGKEESRAREEKGGAAGKAKEEVYAEEKKCAKKSDQAGSTKEDCTKAEA